MIKRLFPIILGFLAVFLAWKDAQAAYLILTRIGDVSTSGLLYSSWTYTGPSAPDLAGTATPSATVAVTVNAVTSTTSAATDGTWDVTPTNIVSGDNSVSIASGNEVIAFTLTYDQSATPTATITPTPTATATSLPETGSLWWPITIMAAGITVFLAGKTARDKIDELPGR